MSRIPVEDPDEVGHILASRPAEKEEPELPGSLLLSETTTLDDGGVPTKRSQLGNPLTDGGELTGERGGELSRRAAAGGDYHEVGHAAPYRSNRRCTESAWYAGSPSSRGV